MFVCCLCVSFSDLYEAKGTTAGETLKRGRLYLSSCGLKPPTMAAKLKAVAKVSVGRKRDVQSELARDDLTTVRLYMSVVKGCTIQIIRKKNQSQGAELVLGEQFLPRLRDAELSYNGVGQSIPEPQGRHALTIWASFL